MIKHLTIFVFPALITGSLVQDIRHITNAGSGIRKLAPAARRYATEYALYHRNFVD